MSGIYGVYTVQPNPLASKDPASFLDYTENLAAVLTDPESGLVDALTQLSLSAAPSGTGELAVSRLSVDQTGLLVTFWLAGGVAGRSYTLSLVATTAAGRVYQWLLSVAIDATLASYPPPAPESTGFSNPVQWSAD